MESSLFNKKPSVLPRRNPALHNAKFLSNSAVGPTEMEARNRLMQIHTRTISLPSRGPRLHSSADSSVELSNADDEGDEGMSPVEELRREREAILSVRKHTSVAPSSISRPQVALAEDDVDPRVELKGERKESIVPKPFGEANRKSSRVPARTPIFLATEQRVGSSLPVVAFGRTESKVPPNTKKAHSSDSPVHEHTGASLPVKAFGRHCRESQVLPSTAPKDEQSLNVHVEDHVGASLPIKTFGRHESKVPPNTTWQDVHADSVASHTGASLPVHAFARIESKVPGSFVATSGEPKRMDRQSIVPPSTKKTERDENCVAGLSHIEVDSSKASSHGNTPGSEPVNKPARTTLGNIARAFRKKHSPSESMDPPVRRMLSLPANRLPSFRRKPTNFVAAG